MKQALATAVLMAAFAAAFATSSSAGALQKPDQIHGSCGRDDTYFPPDSSGAYACVKKDGSGIVCGGSSDEYKKSCDSWSASGKPPSRASDSVRSAAQKNKAAADKAAADKAAADKAAADKAKADKAAADKAAADKAAAEKAKAPKPTADKPATDKPAADKPATNKPAENKPAADKPASAAAGKIHDCPGIKPNCTAWAPKDGNTCRSCQLAQCRTENGGEVVGGNKTQNQCYEGHGSPPSDFQ